jgi:glycosyltransferase involved in cell wall biosynthesis
MTGVSPRDFVVTVSAVMPTYNMAPYIAAAIDSVLAQEFQDWELIIVDDGSTDDTCTVLSRYTDSRIRVHRCAANRGRAAARNLGIGLARGRYIAICDSDDISLPDRFSQQVAFLDANPDVDVVSSDLKFFWGQEPPRARTVFPETPEAIRRRFLRGHMGIAHGACMLRSACFEQFGLYCEDLRSAEDFELFLRMQPEGRFFRLPQVLLLYRHELRGVPLRKWVENKRWHRYARYRSELRRSGHDDHLSFQQFCKRWSVRVALVTVDLLRFVKYHVRA